MYFELLEEGVGIETTQTLSNFGDHSDMSLLTNYLCTAGLQIAQLILTRYFRYLNFFNQSEEDQKCSMPQNIQCTQVLKMSPPAHSEIKKNIVSYMAG